MSSLDEVFEQLKLFSRALADFNEQLRGSTTALTASHDQVRALWNDEASRQYMLVYGPLSESLDEYLRGPAPRFEQFLGSKLHQLEQYLHGG